jgi:DNA-binding IclR family transcriptional regulator
MPQGVKQAADRRAAKPVAAVDRAMSLLLAFRPGEDALSLSELAVRSGFYKSTILRLLGTLERRAFIARLADGRYRLGPVLLHLGNMHQKSFRLEDIVRPELVRLADSTGESSSFFVSDGTQRFCLFRVETKQSIRHTVELGQPLPMGRGASGTVLTTFAGGLANTPAKAFRALPVVVIGKDPLDISVITGPVFGLGGALVGAVTVSGPASRFVEAPRRRALPFLMEALRTVTAKLGGDPDALTVTRGKGLS